MKHKKAKKPAIAKKQAAEARRAKEEQHRVLGKKLSANAKIIRDLMSQSGLKGNYKDHVILAGKRLVDWQGSYDLVREVDGKTVGMDGMAIIHKSKLEALLGSELARDFWRSGIGRVNRG